MSDITPMMQQYNSIKEKNGDCILFFRLGDFYEMFSDDAKIASEELDLTLTTRDRGKEKEDQVPMCGVPYHSSEAYIARLIAKGYKVAICEQMEDPALTKGLVKREVVRVVTPGTLIDSSMLEETKNNFIASVYVAEGGAGICFADISTGEMKLMEIAAKEPVEPVIDELFSILPSECILGGPLAEDAELLEFLKNRILCRCETGRQAFFEEQKAREALCRHFGEDVELPGGFGAAAAGALINYLNETQKTNLSHIRRLEYYSKDEYLELDITARRNLELTRTMRSNEKKGSLLGVLDKTKTAMGHRFLRSQLERPLRSPVEIRRRLNAVNEMLRDTVSRGELRRLLERVRDLERIMARIVYGNANARDLVSLAESVEPLPEIKSGLLPFQSAEFKSIQDGLDALSDIYEEINRAIVSEPPFSVREGGLISPGYSEEVDRLNDILNGGGGLLTRIEARERENTGIKNLKVSYNKVFGYYIEVSKSNYDLVPDSYIRKQTLSNCERYITSELKDLENTILTARESIARLEYEIFCDLRNAVARRVDRVQTTAANIAKLDMLVCFAEVAEQNGYCMPEVDNSDVLSITDGRHPVVERMIKDAPFVPNDTAMDCSTSRVAIITGPNMAGKSTYMRQVALIVILAQIGSFVPAKSARIGMVDKIFTRVGASDDLAAGHSTFMLEMIEMAAILKNATSRSLLVLDEIGRGTSTFDGMAIARAVLEYCVDKRKLGAKTMFATHYHELTVLEDELEGVKNYNIAAKKRSGEIIFLRKIVRGGADDSYGIEVAKLAGLPKNVVERANQILDTLENDQPVESVRAAAPPPDQLSLMDMGSDEVARKLRVTDLNTITPLEAMNLLYELKKMVD